MEKFKLIVPTSQTKVLLCDGMNCNKETCYFRNITYGMIEPIIKKWC